MMTQEQTDHKQGEQPAPAPVPALPPGSIYSDAEEIWLGPWQKIRQTVLSPVAFVFIRLGLGANVLSAASVLFGFGFFLLAAFRFDIAFWLLVASIICDGLDGVEARLTRTNTARGAFIDMFCDQLVVAFSVAGLAWKGLAHPVLAVLFVYIYTALVTFLVLHKLQRVSSAGLVRPSRMLLYSAVGLYFFFSINVINYLLIVYLLAFPLVFLSFWRLRKAM